MKTFVTLLLTLLPGLLLAHPGHGIGQLGHDTQHTLWNFAAMVVVAAVVLAVLRTKDKRK